MADRIFFLIHPDKTKNLSNQSANKRTEVEINNIKVEILLVVESAKYLGQRITFQQQETAQIKHRIWAAWASSTDTGLQHRLHLFQRGDHADAVQRLWNLDTITKE